eukprot:4138172-Amphidinium_carterae.1
MSWCSNRTPDGANRGFLGMLCSIVVVLALSLSLRGTTESRTTRTCNLLFVTARFVLCTTIEVKQLQSDVADLSDEISNLKKALCQALRDPTAPTCFSRICTDRTSVLKEEREAFERCYEHKELSPVKKAVAQNKALNGSNVDSNQKRGSLHTDPKKYPHPLPDPHYDSLGDTVAGRTLIQFVCLHERMTAAAWLNHRTLPAVSLSAMPAVEIFSIDYSGFTGIKSWK